MMLRTKSRLFWPGIWSDLDKFYNQCQNCALNKDSKPQKKNEINMSSLFENFFPGNRVQGLARPDFDHRDRDRY